MFLPLGGGITFSTRVLTSCSSLDSSTTLCKLRESLYATLYRVPPSLVLSILIQTLGFTDGNQGRARIVLWHRPGVNVYHTVDIVLCDTIKNLWSRSLFSSGMMQRCWGNARIESYNSCCASNTKHNLPRSTLRVVYSNNIYYRMVATLHERRLPS